MECCGEKRDLCSTFISIYLHRYNEQSIDRIANIPLKRPLTPFTLDKFLNPEPADVINVAALLQREGVRTIIINTLHEVKSPDDMSRHTATIGEATQKRWVDPISLLLEIPHITCGYYYEIDEWG